MGGRDPIIGSIPLDGMQLFIPTSAVPPDVRDYLTYKKQAQIEQIKGRSRGMPGPGMCFTGGSPVSTEVLA